MADSSRAGRSREPRPSKSEERTQSAGRLREVRPYCAVIRRPCLRTDVPETVEPRAVFLSYPSENPQTEATLRSVARSAVDFTPLDWRELFRAGQPVFCEVCKATHRCQAVAADLSRFNLNVAFEAGYAFGMNRLLLPLADASLQRLHVPNLIDSTLQVRYHEVGDILRGIGKAMRDAPEPPGAAAAPTPAAVAYPSALLYVMAPHRSDAATAIGARLAQSSSLFRVLQDDPREIPDRALSWYEDMLKVCPAVLIHLLGDERQGHSEHNQKAAFIAGLAVARGRRVLMVQEAGKTRPPIDYRALLVLYRDHEHALILIEEWLKDFETLIVDEQARTKASELRSKALGRLFEVDLGDPAAENEDALSSYYIDMSWTQALKGGHGLLYVGEKGAGKTAALLSLQDTFAGPNHFFCARSLEEYALERIFHLVGPVSNAETRFAFGALWKYLLLLEMTETFLHDAGPKAQLSAMTAAVELGKRIGHRPNVMQLEEIVESLRRPGDDLPSLPIAQALHQRTIPELIALLAQCLKPFHACHLALDNLDRSWDVHSPLGRQAMVELVLACQQLWREFRLHQVSLGISVFLRDDVHRQIQGVGVDWTKIPVQRLEWTADALKRMVAVRLDRREVRDADEVWKDYVVEKVHGERAADFVLRRAFPRPRDVLVWLHDALMHARDAGHSQIEAGDLLFAQRRYHVYLLETWLVYLRGLPGDCEEIVVGLAESAAGGAELGVRHLLAKGGVPEEFVSTYIESLVALGMLTVGDPEHGQTGSVPLAKRLVLARRPQNLRVHPIVSAVLSSQYGGDH